MADFEPVDLESQIPYYLQMKNSLQNLIEAEKLVPGEKLPSEAQLCSMLQVSRTVVRQALTELAHEGFIYKAKGKGTFIAEPKVTLSLVRLRTSLREDKNDSEPVMTTTVLSQEVISADERHLKLIKSITPGDQLIYLKRLRFMNGSPIVLYHSYLPYATCSALLGADLTRSLYVNLKECCNIEFNYGTRSMEAVGANMEESQLFDVEPGTPMLLYHSECFTADDQLIEYSLAVHRGDRVRFEGKMIHTPPHSKNHGKKYDLENFSFTWD